MIDTAGLWAAPVVGEDAKYNPDGRHFALVPRGESGGLVIWADGSSGVHSVEELNSMDLVWEVLDDMPPDFDLGDLLTRPWD